MKKTPSHKRDNDCACDFCRLGNKKALALERDMMKKYGWVVHYVSQTSHPLFINAHTHGLPENFNHPDLQIVVPIQPINAHKMFSNALELIKTGTRFEPGHFYSGVLRTYLIKTVEQTEGDRKVIRLIGPNREGHFDDPKYLEQETCRPDDP